MKTSIPSLIIGIIGFVGISVLAITRYYELETKKFNHESYMDSCRMKSQAASDSFYLEIRRGNDIMEKKYSELK